MNKTFVLNQVKDWVFPFGKYKDQKIADVYQVDKKYCEWLYEKLEDDNQTKMAMKLICTNIGSTNEDNINTGKILDLQAEKFRRAK